MNLTEQELSTIRVLVQHFNQVKMQLGDTVISQQELLKKVDEIKASYVDMEGLLMETYGKDAIINIETGEVKMPEETEK